MHMIWILGLLALAQDLPDRPPEGQFIVDGAKLVRESDAALIRTLCAEALSKRRIPIIVVTVDRLPQFFGVPEPIERTSQQLFAKWGIGWPEWNYGILLLVSTGDRKARIELGADWAHRKDDESEQIMRELILPAFKKGEYGRGILDGVRGLHAMALGLSIPRGSWATRLFTGRGLFWLVVILVVLAVGGDAIRGGGSTGCSPFGMGCLGSMFGNWLTSDRSWGSSSGGGSWGGGSFGGGFGGGGGASGSW